MTRALRKSDFCKRHSQSSVAALQDKSVSWRVGIVTMIDLDNIDLYVRDADPVWTVAGLLSA